MVKPANTWGKRIGFYIVAVGSAFGLGNLWRFPFVLGENGGGAFFLIFVFLAFVVGMPLLLGEYLLGKSTGLSLFDAIVKLDKQGPERPSLAMKSISYLAGRSSIVLCLVVLAYFATISGWVIHYMFEFLVTPFEGGAFVPEQSFQKISDSPWRSLSVLVIHLSLVVGLVAFRFEELTERWVGLLMPLFVFVLLVMVFESTSLPTVEDAMRFLFYPDFSRLTLSSLGQAVGQVFFTLSAGFGTMATIGSFMRKSTYIPALGFRLTLFDTTISVFAALLIFPIVVKEEIEVFGPELLFQTVPTMLVSVSWGEFWGFCFFLCLYLAALAASIGLLQTVVTNFQGMRPQSDHRNTTIIFGLICLLLALVPALSTSVLSRVQWHGKGVMEILDTVLVNWCIPLLGLMISQLVAYRLDYKIKHDEFFQSEVLGSEKMFKHWNYVVRWVVPAIILVSLLLQTVDLFI